MQRSSWELDDSAGQERIENKAQRRTGDDRRQGTKGPCSSISLVRLKRAKRFVAVIWAFSSGELPASQSVCMSGVRFAMATEGIDREQAKDRRNQEFRSSPMDQVMHPSGGFPFSHLARFICGCRMASADRLWEVDRRLLGLEPAAKYEGKARRIAWRFDRA